MKLFATTTVLSTVLMPATATPDRFYEPDNPWIAPGEGDVRSPCPFVNTMANHGFINRNGRNVDLFEMIQRMEDIFDFSIEFVNQVGDNIVDFGLTTTDSEGIERLDIDALFDPDAEEHEASLVRSDRFFGVEESKLVNDTLLNNLVRVNPTSPVLTLQDVMGYQFQRIIDSRTNNPETTFATEFDTLNTAAQALTLFFLGTDPTLQTVEKERVFSMLLLERIPDGYEPGQLQDTPFDFMTDFSAGLFQEFVANVQFALAVEIPDEPDDGDDDDSNGRPGRGKGRGKGGKGRGRRLIH